MAGVPYVYWVKYIEDILDSLNFTPLSILDVACGTGVVSKKLFDKGFNVTGFDLSEDMIEVAKKNYEDIDFYVQNAKNFEIDKKFDLAVSLFDSLNYITNKNDLQSSFFQIRKHLNNNGYLIFDMNTEYALSNNFFAQINIEPDRYPHYVWTPTWDPKTKICEVKMVFHMKEDDGEIIEFKEYHVQRAYSLEELSYMLEKSGFEVVNIYSAYKFTKPTRRSDRVYFVCKAI